MLNLRPPGWSYLWRERLRPLPAAHWYRELWVLMQYSQNGGDPTGAKKIVNNLFLSDIYACLVCCRSKFVAGSQILIYELWTRDDQSWSFRTECVQDGSRVCHHRENQRSFCVLCCITSPLQHRLPPRWRGAWPHFDRRPSARAQRFQTWRLHSLQLRLCPADEEENITVLANKHTCDSWWFSTEQQHVVKSSKRSKLVCLKFMF